MTSKSTVRPIEDPDRAWIDDACTNQWGTSMMVSRGRTFDIARQEGFVAEIDTHPVGFVTFDTEDGEAEIGGLLSLEEGIGIGSQLLKAAEDHAKQIGLRRIWLVTTNDNIEALRFYQRRGFELVAVHRGAVDETRRTVKPNIPKLGMHNIPLRDEIELEIRLAD